MERAWQVQLDLPFFPVEQPRLPLVPNVEIERLAVTDRSVLVLNHQGAIEPGEDKRRNKSQPVMRHHRCLIFVAFSPPICSYSACRGQRAISERTRFRNRLDFRNRTLAHGSSCHQSGFHPMVALATGCSGFHTDSRERTKSALQDPCELSLIT